MSVMNRKVVITKFGDPSCLSIVEEPLAAPGRKEVQVAILYSGFAGADVNMRLGVYPLMKQPPVTPGYCLVGRVHANGPGCQAFSPGDLVCALTVYGSQAKYINIQEKYLIPVPADVDPQDAVNLPLDWCTALQMVRHHAKVQKGQRVFVHGLSGAVGRALLFLCLLKGAVVYGTASERNHAALRKDGAHPYVYTDKKWITAMQALGGVHAVFDPLGLDSLDESWSILCNDEPAICVGYGLNAQVFNRPSYSSSSSSSSSSSWIINRFPLLSILKLLSRNLVFWSSKSGSFYSISGDTSRYKEDMNILLLMLQERKIKVGIKKVWAMEEIQEAHAQWGKGEGMGSLVIKIAD